MSDDKEMANSGRRVRADAARRASEAWQLRVAGFTWDEIARRIGVSDGPAAHRAVSNYFGSVPDVDRGMLRGLARERGEALWRRAFEAVERTEGGPAAVRVAVDVLRRQAALDGLDAPTAVEFRTPDDDELALWVSAVVRMNGATIPVEGDPFADVIDADVVEDE